MRMTSLAPWRRRELQSSEGSTPALFDLRRDIDDLFDSFLDSSFSFPARVGWGASPGFGAVDLKETDEGFDLKVDLPGVAKEDIDVEIAGNVLTVSGERKAEQKDEKGGMHRVERAFGAFRRVLSLPSEVDEGSVRAELHDGVLSVRLSKSEKAKSQVRKIAIK